MNKTIVLALVLLVGCNLKTIEPHENPFEKGLNTTEEPIEDSGILIPETCPEGQHKWLFQCISDDIYCYQDNSRGTHCDCDILTFPDGHNETRNCYCYNDLVMYYTCINITEENITITH